MNNNKPRRIDFFLHDEDYECAYLGALGFSTKYIMSRTKLGGGQINYRLRKAHIRRIDYRDGTSDFATIIQRSLRGPLDKNLTHFLKTGMEAA
jgi:hypothetical protein